MRTVDIHEAKAQLFRLVDDAAAGEEIVIARAGKRPARWTEDLAMSSRSAR
jgi:prevent-host-death family protein